MSRLDEFALIRKLTKQKQPLSLLRKQGVVVGIGDDAAVAGVSSGCEMVMSCDTMVEGIHFNRWTMLDEDIGFKALASNLSDMAAMGAKPKYALVSISIPKHISEFRLQRIYKGLYECARIHKTVLIGGDTTASLHDFILSITIIGEVPSNRALLRSTAKLGDQVFTAGVLGCSAAGLDYLMKRKQANLHLDQIPPALHPLISAHRRPLPQIKAGQLLQRSHACHALNDISDGLASEAWEIAEASQVGIIIYEEHIALAPNLAEYATSSGNNPLDWILYGGEDYALVGTMPPQHTRALQNEFQAEGIDFHVIGEVNDESIAKVSLMSKEGKLQQIAKKGYHHF